MLCRRCEPVRRASPLHCFGGGWQCSWGSHPQQQRTGRVLLPIREPARRKNRCCQLFAELFGQFRRKLRPLRKNSEFQFLKEFGFKKNNFIVCVTGKISFSSLVLEWKREGILFLKFGPFSALFVQNRPKFGGSTAILLFIRPFFTYGAEHSASCNTGKTDGYVVEYLRTYGVRSLKFGIHMQSCTSLAETPQHPPPPIWAHI